MSGISLIGTLKKKWYTNLVWKIVSKVEDCIMKEGATQKSAGP